MTAINRTAYPRPGTKLTREELGARFALTEADLAFIQSTARGDDGRLLLALLLKARQDLGLFPAPDDLHASTVTHLAAQLGITAPTAMDWARRTKSLYRYQGAVRAYLSVTPYGDAAERLVEDVFCGKATEIETVTIEHFVPITAGGTSHMANLSLAHKECNAGASHLSVREKIELAIRNRRMLAMDAESPTSDAA